MTSVATRLSLLTARPSGTATTTAAAGGSCSAALAQDPWQFPASLAAGYGPGASQDDAAPAGSPAQPTIPQRYRDASETELAEMITAAKRTLGDDVVILGHFYQRDEVVAHADFVGDSFQLARAATTQAQARAIVFCGVHFMAETADILSTPEQAVILPNPAAGCSMADMADEESVAECWADLMDVLGPYATDEHGAVRTDEHGEPLASVIPVTYMNSSAALKAFCGRHGGIVCTSSNATTVLEWAFQRGQRVLFFPDQHLGRNTAKAMGVPTDRMPLWDPRRELGGCTANELHEARVILWHGFCSVHKRFTTQQIDRARAEHPDCTVIVHPECPAEVVDAADSAGSTDYIQKAVAAAAPGQTFAIGTEINMVNRLAAQHPEHTIFCLDPVICPCSTMYRIHPGYLAWVLEELVAGRVINQITVPHDVARDASVALDRMLAAAPKPGPR